MLAAKPPITPGRPSTRRVGEIQCSAFFPSLLQVNVSHNPAATLPQQHDQQHQEQNKHRTRQEECKALISLAAFALLPPVGTQNIGILKGIHVGRGNERFLQ